MFTSYSLFILFFFFNDTATTEIYTLSLHDALPISGSAASFISGYEITRVGDPIYSFYGFKVDGIFQKEDRKSTRLNSSHANISYAVFCLKKKKKPLNTE